MVVSQDLIKKTLLWSIKVLLKEVCSILLNLNHILSDFDADLIHIGDVLVVTPTGLLMKALGKDLLRNKYNKDKKSYWIKREKITSTMKQQF